MTAYRSKYLGMLKAENSKKTPGVGTDKNDKNNFVSFVSSQVGAFSPKLDPEGVPRGLCPTCHRGEFWRRPKFHKDHDATGWVCWFCSPPANDKYCADFCGT
jgi:hypothetical protein